MVSNLRSVFRVLAFNFLLIVVSTSARDENIIIVGAGNYFFHLVINFQLHVYVSGSSGYAAACKLLENGFKNVQIFEAENRIGGRTYTKLVKGFALDMGAQWIHGEGGNVVYEMASELNLTKKSVVDVGQYTFIRSNGNLVNGKIGLEQMKFFSVVTNTDEEFGKSSEKMGDYISKK
jgi:Flavin containing amine oxidoreductase